VKIGFYQKGLIILTGQIPLGQIPLGQIPLGEIRFLKLPILVLTNIFLLLDLRIMRLIVVMLCVLPECLFGQYVYFNSSYNPPFPNVGGGTSDNLLVVDSGYMTFGYFPAPPGTYATSHYFVDFLGNQQNEYTYIVPNHGGVSNEFSDAIVHLPVGFLGARAYYDNTVNRYYGRISTYTNQLEENWHYDMLLYQNDSIQYSDYSCARVLNDLNYMALGDVTSDNISDQYNWPTNGDIILTKVQPNGSLIWHKQYPFHELNYFSLTQPFVKTNDLIELANGDLLLWGGWYDQFDPFVIKVDFFGNFIDELHWGNPDLGDWLAWPVQISNHEFMFAYSHATGTSTMGQVLSNIQIGVLNSTTMAINSVHSYDHVYAWGGAVDFEATPDGGFVVLGYGGDPTIPNFMGEAYMMKIDANFNEEWFHAYHPPLAWYSDPNVYDLEVAPDGGLIFVGNFTDNVGPLNHTWIVKTDACGELAYNGCAVGVQEQEAMDFTLGPNPASDVLQVSTPKECVFTRMYDVTGKFIRQDDFHSSSMFQLDIAALTAGLYIIELHFQDGQIMSQRFVKE